MAKVIAVPYAEHPGIYPRRRLLAETVGLNGQPVRWYEAPLRRPSPHRVLGRLRKGRRD